MADLLEITNRATSPPAPEVRKRRKGRSRTGKSESDKNDLGTESTVDSQQFPSSDAGNKEDVVPEDGDMKRKSLDEDPRVSVDINADGDGLCWKDPLNSKIIKDVASDSNNEKESYDVDSSQGGDLSSAHQNEGGIKEAVGGQRCPTSVSQDGLNEEQDVEKKDIVEEGKEEEERQGGMESEDEGSDTSTLTSVSDSDSDSEEVNKDKGKAVADMVTDTKHDIKTAISKGGHLESELTLQRKQAQMLMKQVSKDYESYTDENFDDLFEDIDEEEGQIEVRAGSFSEKSSCKSNEMRDSSPATRPKSLERNANLTMDRSRSMQPVHVDTPTEPPPTMFHSLPYMPAANGDNDEEDDGQIFSQLNEEAYSRHLQAISKDVHTYLGK